MWYFAWVLGVLLACSFGIINAVWLEFQGYEGEAEQD
ncbi:cytochrome bd-I oxidase subunit CydX [Maribrevibacterium harenarium]|uniref:Cytochrome bd-I oxidase subunit CydX n=1 Tax=Maribrevibacterium harenarium TaxID=2589817 RepID=A0A501WTV8_9GAMM|nr:cytochrome bd-I oxidase subunit CydX [Maribrevibacterium harenarium]TPE51554.1 cytochrome bd-I oxidase subunit CydX [Maribrevibacterium harenarium]